MISNTNIRSMNYLNITRQSVSCIVLQSELSTKNKMIYIKSNPEYDHHTGHALFLTTKLEAPSEGEEVEELHNAEEAQSRAETDETAEGCDEILNGVDDVLVVLNQAVILEVDVEQRQVSLAVKILNNFSRKSRGDAGFSSPDTWCSP